MLALLLLLSTLAKIVFRMGLDGAFFRVHYDLPTDAERRRLAGSVALFAAGTGTLLFGAVGLWREGLTRLLFGAIAPPPHFVVLAALDVYLGVFAFVPLNLLRLAGKPGRFSAFSAARHALNTLLKVALVASGWGVLGVLVADAAATGAFALALAPTLRRGAAWSFSTPLLREALRFGLPKLPHGLLLQAQNLADRKILDLFVSRAELGLYQLGYSFGQAVKFPLSAFEPAWQPFVYSRVGQPETPALLARVVTYAWTAFLALGLALAVLARELVRVMTPRSPDFWPAWTVVPVVVLAYLLHGAFLLTSIGIGVRKQAGYYPLITAAAAAANVGANLLLVPRHGMLGAAWATVVSYALMAGLGLFVSQRLYPLPLEWSRLARVSLAAGLAYAAGQLAPAALWPALGVKALALLAYPLLLLALGVPRGEERAWLARRLRRG